MTYYCLEVAAINLMGKLIERNKRLKFFFFIQKIDLKLSPFKTGDIVGCGVNFLKNQIFFTLNGVKSGKIYFSSIFSLKSSNDKC